MLPTRCNAPAARAAPALRIAAAADDQRPLRPRGFYAADAQLANTGLERGAALEKDIAYMQQQWGLQAPVAAEDGIGHRYAKWVLRRREACSRLLVFNDGCCPVGCYWATGQPGGGMAFSCLAWPAGWPCSVHPEAAVPSSPALPLTGCCVSWR